jgi:hypothetical protein
MRFGGVVVAPMRYPATQVLSVRHRLQMGWIYAVANPAQMIDDKAVRNAANMRLV